MLKYSNKNTSEVSILDKVKFSQKTSDDPILERKSDIVGHVSVFPPVAPASEWSTIPWRITTEKSASGGKGLDVLIPADKVMECFTRPHFISESPIEM